MQTDMLRGYFIFKQKEKGTNSEDPVHQECVFTDYVPQNPHKTPCLHLYTNTDAENAEYITTDIGRCKVRVSGRT